MRKSVMVVASTLMVAMLFVGCGKADKKKDKDSDSKSKTETTVAADEKDSDKNSGSEVVSGNDASSDMSMEVDGYTMIFKVSKDFKLHSDAWLGVIPTGTIYTREADADEVDFIYEYCYNLDDESADSYIFEFDTDYILSIEDGTYDMVLCSSDDAEVGEVLVQIGLEKQGDKITLDYANEK